MATEDICEICEREVWTPSTSRISDLAECRKCKSKVCNNCIIGNQCVDCIKDDEEGEAEDRHRKFNIKDW